MAEIVPLPDAIAELVRDGDTVAAEGFTHLIPHAAGHELIRQGRRELTLIRMTPDVIYDQLIGMGCARTLVFSWCGNPGVGSLHRVRDAVEHGWPGPLELQEHSHSGMATAYAAGAANLPFGVLGVQKETVLGSARSIVTVEEIVDELEPRPGAIVLPGWVVGAVALAPHGAHPSYAHGYYDRDNDFYVAWDEISRDRDRFTAWMERHVLGTKDLAEYRSSLAAEGVAA